MCCSINYSPRNRSTLISTNAFGVGSGLNVLLAGSSHLSDGITGAIYSDGMILLVHHPYEFVGETAAITLLRRSRETFVAIDPIITTVSSQVLDLSVSERKCLTPSDLNSEIATGHYEKSTCDSYCMNNRIYDTCGCHPYYLPVAVRADVRECNVSDVYCFSENFCK